MNNLKNILLFVMLSTSCIICMGQGTDTFKQLLDSATQGYSDAQNRLGFEYDAQKNYAEAIKWYLKAAEQNNVKSFHNLSIKYYLGQGVEKDEKKAFDYAFKAANLGHIDAEYNLGIFYYRGIGVAADRNEGIKWIKKAAQKSVVSQAWLGEFYWKLAAQASKSKYIDEQEKVHKYNEEAIHWLTLAADNGNVEAAINVANYFYKKEDNLSKAMRYVLYACQQNDENALKMYEEITGASYSSLDKNFKNNVKTYTGKYPLGGSLTNNYGKNNITTYEYYELGYMRVFHGKFSVEASTGAGRIEDKNTLSIIGQFKDDYREGEWKVKSCKKTFEGKEYDITMNYQNGKLNGPFECITKDIKTGKVLIAEQTFYKDNVIVGKFTRKDANGYYEDVEIDDEGNAHGKFIVGDTECKLQGDFLHGTCNNIRYINLQTGETKERSAKCKCPISPSWEARDGHIIQTLHHISAFHKGLLEPWRAVRY